jgi:glutaminase A-like protein
MVAKWDDAAKEGEYYRLAFDRPGTWSQKYNLVWDTLLGYKLFPDQVRRRELAYYKTRQNTYGLPLDNRADYTKGDWIVWTATLSETPADFSALVGPILTFLHETPDRVPFTDWYSTTSGLKRGFQARSVVGGVFIPMLSNRDLVRKWSSAPGL